MVWNLPKYIPSGSDVKHFSLILDVLYNAIRAAAAIVTTPFNFFIVRQKNIYIVLNKNLPLKNFDLFAEVSCFTLGSGMASY